MLKLITIIGARPQIIKSAAISRAIKNHFQSDIEEYIIHTGQHYDENMSEVFFEEMEIPKPYINLQIGSGSHAQQTAGMMNALEKHLQEIQADALLIYGDTNSTIAAALTCSKIGIPVIHVEAGLRSFNKSMPEEINRILSDHVSTLLFCPTQTAVENLKKEGFDLNIKYPSNIDNPSVYHCGDIMYDNSMFFSQKAMEQSSILQKLQLNSDEFILATIHRNNNTDINERLVSIVEIFLHLVETYSYKIVFPIHPRTQKNFSENLPKELWNKFSTHPKIICIPPAGFLDMIQLERNAKYIVTDSGGVQKESYFFKKPCFILRSETEWVEIVTNGNAVVCDVNKDLFFNSFQYFEKNQNLTYPPFFGDGKAADFIVQEIVKQLKKC
ncbi:MAG: UDP-N-acetylglucosamine 2-epimerase (non-hydrolyzing) [Flavobacteriia bacterium]|nr:UDP-N-acetylglucosamine 2-epimerase (non-hydrolyzing) [Flavobacteriia bacterium]